jgi:hypothetical protein
VAIAQHSPQALDAQLRSDVVRALDDDPDVPGRHIEVAVVDHVVTLSGTVTSDGERAATIAAARSVTGVVIVIDDVVVDEKRSDSTEREIALAVRHELTQLTGELSTVQATVRDGVVTLTGVADDRCRKHSLMFAIRDIPGVLWVEDQMDAGERALHDGVRRALAPQHLRDADQVGITRNEDNKTMRR